ncbi:MAG TPA: lactate utilization protein C [Candidatus Sulfomarinibacteraceae bacterium]|nr:lactate utilization protein C [Candidatus Sulfomarinibacteraceae bacterium]
MTASGNARREILARIREALRVPVPDHTVPRDYLRTISPEVDAIELFAARVADYHATVIRATSAGLPSAVAAALRQRGVRTLVIPPGLPTAWLSEAVVDQLPDSPPLSKAALDHADGVITGCAVAIAETGTIVLDAGSGQGRRALSLLPDYHLCIVRTGQLVGDVPEAMGVLDPRRPLTWISGPSATSDIELQRVEGVHGPRILDIVLVDESGAGRRWPDAMSNVTRGTRRDPARRRY